VQFIMQHPQDLWALCRNYSAPVAQTFAPAPASPQPPTSPSLPPAPMHQTTFGRRRWTVIDQAIGVR